MNEPRYRAWHKKNKVMGIVTGFDFVNGRVTIIFDKGPVQYQISDVELMLYTGYIDSNKVEVCEGDLVVTSVSPRPKVVEWKSDRGGRIGFNISGKSFHEKEVIGNVFENPELIDSKYTPTQAAKLKEEEKETPVKDYGWVCPKCGSVWAVWVSQCATCAPVPPVSPAPYQPYHGCDCKVGRVENVYTFHSCRNRKESLLDQIGEHGE